MGIRDFLDNFRGQGKNKLTRSDDGEIVTVEKKQQQDAQKAEAEKIEAEKKAKQVNKDIREALALLNDSPTENTSPNKKTKDSKVKQQSKPVTPKQQPRPQPQHIDIDDNIDIPIDNKTIPPDYDLHKYAAEAINLLDQPTTSTNYSKN